MPVCTTCSREIALRQPFCSWCGSPNPEATPTGETAPTDGEVLARRLQAALGDDFAVEHELGAGGFAVVFSVFERRLSRRIAVKVLRPELVASRSSRQRFVREAESVARLNHPHVLPIFFVGENAGLVYFGMPLVEGETLESRLRREGRLEPAEAARIGSEIADALAEAHAAGLVHRDIKPLNVMLQGSRGRVLVADFGIAKAAAGSGESLTGTGIAIGSPHYMSPEQAAGEEGVDHRSDLYSLGILLWQMLAGELPFEAARSQAVLMQQVTRDVPPIRTRRPDVPPQLAAVVERCVEKPRELRYQSADEVARELRAIGSTPQGLPAARRLGGPRTWAIAAVVLVLAAAGLYVLVSGAVGGARDAMREPGPPAPAGASASAAVPESPSPIIAVLPLTVVSSGDTAQFSRAAALMLSEALALRNGVRTVDPNGVLGRWIEQGRRTTAPLDSNARFAYSLGANQMIVGNYVESGRTFRLSASMYDTHDATPLWRGEVTGLTDSLFSLLDRLATQAAQALCGQPAYNPAGLCFDSAARPERSLAVTSDSGGAPLRFLARVSADGAVTDVRVGEPSGDEDLTARALEAVVTTRFVPARKAGRPVEAWAELEVPVLAAGTALGAFAAGCEDPEAGVRNADRACFDSRPVPQGRLPVLPAPAACAGEPQPATLLVRVSASGAVVGAPSVRRGSDCDAFTGAATGLAAGMTFAPALKDGRPVEAWTLLLVRAAPAGSGGTQ